MLVWRVRWWWIRRWVSWVAPGKVPRLSMNATSCPNGVLAAADKLPLLRPFLPLPCPPVHWARSSSREGTPSKKGLPVINVFALWHCCSLFFFSCVCLSCNKIIIPYAWLAWLLLCCDLVARVRPIDPSSTLLFMGTKTMMMIKL